MVRSALKSKRRIGEGPVRGAAYVPAASVALASLLASLPILSQNGWYPDFGFLTDRMEVRNASDVKIAGNLIQPRAEAAVLQDPVDAG